MQIGDLNISGSDEGFGWKFGSGCADQGWPVVEVANPIIVREN